MKAFDLRTVRLEGTTLIEAGAGTGKTYTLTGIFLRLIVEHGLGIDRILVVTYTKAATEELKTRIRDSLLTAKAVFNGRSTTDEFLRHLVSQCGNRPSALQRVEDALTDFDRAAIFTIHGFCQRLLQHFAFETGHIFHSELVQDQETLIQEVADDFWRRHIARAPYELVHYALETLKGPEQLAMVLLNYCRFPYVTMLPPAVKPPLRAVAPWRRAAERMMQLWPFERDRVLNLLLDPGLNARFFGKCEPDGNRTGPSQRRQRLEALAGEMDLWNGKYPLFEKAERFGSAFLARATKKNCITPCNPFFDACQNAVSRQVRMVDQLADYLRYLKIRLQGEIRRQLERKKARRNILFFDDLLLHVHDALNDRQGHELIRAVRRQYKAALVDEFQDTDPLQYDIFKRLFSRDSDLLFMIGDPKQAIYSFRGADVFSYLKAAASAQTDYTLTKNWRSTPTLVRAVNTIFGNRALPFGFKTIRFNPGTAAQAESAQKQWPLKLWYLTRHQNDSADKPISQQAATTAIAAAVAEEIVRLTSDPAFDVCPSRIAVLTRTHKQSQIVKRALAQKSVPAVLHSAGNVFDSEEAETIFRVMAAAAAPYDPVAVRAALAGDLLGVDAHALHGALENPSEHWQARWTAFGRDHRIWIRHGFYRMFRGLMVRENVKARVLSLPDGERRLTNLLHLSELLQHAESEHRLGPEGLLKWLTVQRLSTSQRSDEQQLRLESDALAVRIITMHKSKGLQFDVVFCPFVWSGTAGNETAALFHDQAHDYRLTMEMGPDIAPEHQLQARKEVLAENLRMMYVALTRAQRMCYLAWGRINNTELSAPAYLLHAPVAETDSEDWLSPLTRKLRTLDDAGLVGELQQLGRRSDGSIVVEPLPAGTASSYMATEQSTKIKGYRTVSRSITDTWRIASFSSLTAGASAEQDEWPDRDPITTPGGQPAAPQESFSGLFGFPRGAHAGLFFHDLLENWDPSEPDEKVHQALAAAKLKSHGFDERWHTAVVQMLAALAAMPLKVQQDSFSLAQVPKDQRINEMEFYFPLQTTGPEALKRLFGDHAGALLGRMPEQRLERLTFAPVQGYLKGYIDSIFRYGGRYYLVDWKSNHLGDDYSDYLPEALARTMVKDYYFLQYHLYTTALNQLLKQKIEKYDYASHFGGVFYIFLRAIAPDRNVPAGLFYDCPDPDLVAALTQLLIGKR